jgi:hypothetical protein
LGCNMHHFMHADCCQGFMKFRKDKGEKSHCPFCRTLIDEDKIVTLEFKGLESRYSMRKIEV